MSVRQFGVQPRGLSPDEVFVTRLFAATFFVQHGITPTVGEVARGRGITIEQARGCIYSIDYPRLSQRVAS